MSARRDPGPQLQRQLGYLLKHAFLTLEELLREQLEPFDLTARELTVLLFLDGREPESQQEAAGRLGVDRTTMVALLDALETKGLVVRHADARDRRRNVVELTKSGIQLLTRATKAAGVAERQLLAGFDGAESAQLRDLLVRIELGPDATGMKRRTP